MNKKMRVVELVILGFIFTSVQAEEIINQLDKNKISLTKPKKINITNEINRILTERKTGERLTLGNLYHKFNFDLPNKMKRIDIVQAPLFFKNNVEDYNVILEFLIENMNEKVNFVEEKNIPETKLKSIKFNYSKLKDCSRIHHEKYDEYFKQINRSYINKLSIDQQDKLYLESNAGSQLSKQLLAGCITYFNKAIDNYTELINPSTSQLIIQNTTQENFPKLVQSIIDSKSMDNKERNQWLQILPTMTNSQLDELRNILETEKRKLDAIEKKYSSH